MPQKTHLHRAWAWENKSAMKTTNMITAAAEEQNRITARLVRVEEQNSAKLALVMTAAAEKQNRITVRLVGVEEQNTAKLARLLAV